MRNSTIMLKHIILFTAIFLVNCLNLTKTDDETKSNCKTCIDGISSATGSYFNLDSVVVQGTAAKLYWREHFESDEPQTLMFGTDKTYSSGNIDLKPIHVDTQRMTTISPLVPDTRYYVRFYRPYWATSTGFVSFRMKNCIDGVTSATGKEFSVDSIKIYSTSAELFWTDHWDNGDTQMVMYGTDTSCSAATINLKPFADNVQRKTTLNQLMPDKCYYVKFRRYWGDIEVDPDSINGDVRFRFTTPSN